MAEAEQEQLEEEEKLEEGEGEDGKKKFPLKFIIIFVAFLLLAGGGFFVWKSGMIGGKSPEAVAAKEDDGGKPDIGPIYNLATFIVNLADPRGKKYLKVRIDLELDDEEVKEEIDKRLPQFRDTVLTLLSSKHYEDINALEGKLQLRAEIISMLNQYLNTGIITNLYFTEFIVQ